MIIDMKNIERSAYSFMLECCERLHLPELCADQALCRFNRMSVNDKKLLGLSVKSQNDVLATFCYLLYSAFIKHDCLISLDDLCNASGCVRRRVWKIIKMDENLNSIIVSPTHMLNRYINLFRISKEDKIAIRRRCDELQSFFGHNPKTIIAYSIYFTIRESKNPSCMYSLKDICFEIGITPTCIFRLRRIIKSENKS